jgi:hypothetical protein
VGCCPPVLPELEVSGNAEDRQRVEQEEAGQVPAARLAGKDLGIATELDPLVRKVIGSLEFALCNPECEMERPSEWIDHDLEALELDAGLESEVGRIPIDADYGESGPHPNAD